MVHDIEMPPSQLIFCKVNNTIVLMSTMCSILFILQMTFERFYSIIQPHKAASVNTVKRAKITIVVVIISSIFFNIPVIFTSTNIGKECVAWARDIWDRPVVQLHYYTSVVINFVLPFVLLLIMNSFIIHTLRTRSILKITSSEGQGQNEGQKSKMNSSERQIFILLLLVTFAFLVFATPGYALIMYVNFVNYTRSPAAFAEYHLVFHISQKSYFTNYGINFFLYVISGQKFRSDLVSLFKCQRQQEFKMNVKSNSDSTHISYT